MSYFSNFNSPHINSRTYKMQKTTLLVIAIELGRNIYMYIFFAMVPVSNVSEISTPTGPPANTRILRRSSPRVEEIAVPVSKRDPADFASAGLAGFPHAFDLNSRGASKRLRKSPFVGSIFPDL